jgi:type IV pilus assembly protein PilB
MARLLRRNGSTDTLLAGGLVAESNVAVLELPERGNHEQLGQMLARVGATTTEQLNDALTMHAKTGRRIGECLVAQNVDSREIAKALAAQFALDLVDLKDTTTEPDALTLIPESTVRTLQALPLNIFGGELYVAVTDPTDRRLCNLLPQLPGATRYRLVLAERVELDSAINRAYRALEGVEGNVAQFEEMYVPSFPPRTIVMEESAPVVQVVNKLVTQALRDRASDVHIEPMDDRVRVRFRVDGAMHEVLSLPSTMAAAVVSRLKIMAEMNIVEKRRPQDGQFGTSVDGRDLDVRVSTTPTVWGEKAVLRLLDKSRSLLSLGQLGMPPATQELYERLVRTPFGMVLCSGPTGSGKTTTLYATLAELNSADVNVMTIEDPVEYVVPSINQIQINAQAGVTFAGGLRSILRQDPDIILVGEIRDAETARIAIQSALTGHLVLSSVHATDAASSLVRLLDMGIEPFLIASAVIAVQAQRLVRRICTSCRAPYTPTPEEVAFYKQSWGAPKDNFTKGTGCEFCSGTGYRERIGVYEVLEVTDEIRQLIIEGASPHQVRMMAQKQGMQTMNQEGIRMIFEDITTISEIIRCIYVM